MGFRLPQITSLLREGEVSLAQADRLLADHPAPPGVTRPDTRPTPAPAHPAAPAPEPGPGAGAGAGTGAGDEPGAGPDSAGRGRAWAGLWRGGDLHAAADDLFARFLPGMDPAQLRVLGAHLREAADARDRAGDDYNTFAARSLRISRSLGGTAHLSGHLHPEAAEQVLAAFEELGAKTGPADTRTKPQRWADALTYLTSLIYPAQPAPVPPAPAPAPSAPAPATSGPDAPAAAVERTFPPAPARTRPRPRRRSRHAHVGSTDSGPSHGPARNRSPSGGGPSRQPREDGPAPTVGRPPTPRPAR